MRQSLSSTIFIPGESLTWKEDSKARILSGTAKRNVIVRMRNLAYVTFFGHIFEPYLSLFRILYSCKLVTCTLSSYLPSPSLPLCWCRVLTCSSFGNVLDGVGREGNHFSAPLLVGGKHDPHQRQPRGEARHAELGALQCNTISPATHLSSSACNATLPVLRLLRLDFFAYFFYTLFLLIYGT